MTTHEKAAADIVSLPIELTKKIVDSKFRLVHIAAQRVRELSSGSPAIVHTRSIKDTTVSLEEALTGRFKILIGEEAKKAKEEQRKRDEQARIDEELSAKEEEIRKELSVYLSEKQEGEEAEEGEETAAEEPVEAEPGEEAEAGKAESGNE